MVRVAEYGLRQPFCGFIRLLWSNAAESLWPKTSVSKDAVCFGFISSDREWASAVLLLTNEQDCRARGDEQRAASTSRWSEKHRARVEAFITPTPASRVQAFAIGRATPTEDQ